ncbi:MAG TPA: hypothetical protein VML19_10440 [Verrucomicrobiae bacterium]|nr:hypothetical protein [Verrucomicrobiae bacterium]
MDDFRVGSISPYDSIHRQHADDASGRKKRKPQDHSAEPEEDIVEISEQAAEEDSGTGYGPGRGGA